LIGGRGQHAVSSLPQIAVEIISAVGSNLARREVNTMRGA
jgi:hypothetical protein